MKKYIFSLIILFGCADAQSVYEDAASLQSFDGGTVNNSYTPPVGSGHEMSIPRTIRDASAIFVPIGTDAGVQPCECHILPIEDPPYVCFTQVCYGNCMMRFNVPPVCFYIGGDPPE